jgi:hypothetical protein
MAINVTQQLVRLSNPCAVQPPEDVMIRPLNQKPEVSDAEQIYLLI